VAAPARRGRSGRPARRLGLETLEGRLTPTAGVSAQDLAGFKSNIDHIVVIYQENWSFDGLYGFFPGANGLANAVGADGLYSTPQLDKNGNVLTSLPNPSTDPHVPGGLPVGPYDLNRYVAPDAMSNDIVHRYYTEQLQMGNGALQPGSNNNNKFVSWSDNGSVVPSYYDATNLPEGLLAQQYTMADNFFHAAYGGSFLNHQWLVAAATPQWNQPLPTSSSSFVSSWSPATQTLNDGNLPPTGRYVDNTTFGAQAPHPGVPADQLLAPINDVDRSRPGFTATVGDRLDDAGISWKWYSGGWSDALNGNADPLFQYHHQPFAYYAKYAPLNPDGTQNPLTSSLLNPNAHLQDQSELYNDLAYGTLPAVSFIKQLGPDNEHPGYASLLRGQQATANLVRAIQNSSAWEHTAIVITYDENGGRYDHVSAPNNNGIWGDGVRVPAIVISPFAKRGFVDHEEHDTLSILNTIEQRFDLQPLSRYDANASSLVNDFVFPDQDAEALRQQIQAVRGEIVALRGEVAQLRAQLGQDMRDASRLGRQLEQVQAALEQDAPGSRQYFRDLRREQALEGQLVATQEQIAQDRAALQSARADLRADLAEAQRLRASLEALLGGGS
jgi:phospholipase C